jgi:hypothetical protein
MVPPRAAHARTSAAVGRRSVIAGGASDGGDADAESAGDSDAFAGDASGGVDGTSGGARDESTGDGSPGACRITLPSTGTAGFGAEAHPARTTTADT